MHCKKELAVFPSPAGMSLIKLFLGGNNLFFFPPRESFVSDIPAGDGKMANSFLQCVLYCDKKVSGKILRSPHVDVAFAHTAPLVSKHR
jgi:hypothetical protein